jgi:hypothetical protein
MRKFKRWYKVRRARARQSCIAQRMLIEAQDRIGRLLREVGDKSREVMMAPKPDPGDRG